MNTHRLESQPFQGGSSARYRAARRELRTQAARLLDRPLAQVRIAPAALTLERRSDDRWLPVSRDVVDEHEWRIRHTPNAVYRLTITIRTAQATLRRD